MAETFEAPTGDPVVPKPINAVLFGTCRIEIEGTPLQPDTRKALALLSYLLLEEKPVQRDFLSSLLWTSPKASSRQVSLRRTLSALNKVLKDAGALPLEADRKQIAIASEQSVNCDALKFEHMLSEVAFEETLSAEKLFQIEEAISLYQTPFLAGLQIRGAPEFELWCAERNESFFRKALRVYELLVQAFLAQGNHAKAIQHLQHWLFLDPIDEFAHRTLIGCYLATGQRTTAIEQYQACVAVLEEELGVVPEEDTTLLYESIQSESSDAIALALEDAGIPVSVGLTSSSKSDLSEKSASEVPAKKSMTKEEGSELTKRQEITSPTPRLAEQKRLLDCLQQKSNRLITLKGSGGSGKTFLIQLLEHQLFARYPDGVSFAFLEGVVTHQDLLEKISETLGGIESSMTSICSFLEGKELLLILDGFECLQQGDSFVRELLSRTSSCQVLLTTRVALGWPEECCFELEGLSYLPADNEDWRQVESVLYLLHHSRQGKPDFAFQDKDALFVLELCREFGGNPLALRLAASWMRLFSCEEILLQFREDPRLFQAKEWGIPQRQKGLIENALYAWELLPPELQDFCLAASGLELEFSAEKYLEETGSSREGLSELQRHSILTPRGDGLFSFPPAFPWFLQQTT